MDGVMGELALLNDIPMSWQRSAKRMHIEYLIILPVGLAGSLFAIRQARSYRLRRDKAKAIHLHREMRALKKAIKQAANET